MALNEFVPNLLATRRASTESATGATCAEGHRKHWSASYWLSYASISLVLLPEIGMSKVYLPNLLATRRATGATSHRKHSNAIYWLFWASVASVIPEIVLGTVYVPKHQVSNTYRMDNISLWNSWILYCILCFFLCIRKKKL